MSILNTEKKRKILLVEDDLIVQIVHQNYLQELGCEVDLVGNGKAALAAIDNYYDLIFMDIGLPDILGTEIIKEFRKKYVKKKDVPIIVLTGFSSESSKQEFLASGANDVAIKPIFLDQLENILVRYCTPAENS
jgi:CheY-like chemotaxis protein